MTHGLFLFNSSGETIALLKSFAAQVNAGKALGVGVAGAGKALGTGAVTALYDEAIHERSVERSVDQNTANYLNN